MTNMEVLKRERLKFPLEIAKLFENFGKNKILGARITATDHLKKGLNIKDAIKLCKGLDKIGLELCCVSSGGSKEKPLENLKIFLDPISRSKLKKGTNLIVGITGLTSNFKKAEKFIRKKYFDIIFCWKTFFKKSFFLIS